MLENFKKWWNRKEIEQQRQEQLRQEQQARDQQFLDELQRYSDALNAERATAAALKEELSEVKEEVGVFRLKEEADRLKREGKEPWVEIKSADYSEIKGIQIELDWNEAFIQYLKDNGIKGQDEEATVQKWLAFLYQDLIGKLEEVTIANSDKPRVNDFE